MKTLEERIAELKDGRTLAQLKKEDIKTFYKVRSLSDKLSIEKARDKGNFITKEHLIEYKRLIIWILEKKVNYKGCLNLKKAMRILLETIETEKVNEKIVYKTEKSIKRIVVWQTIIAGLEDVQDNFREAHGFTVLDHVTGNPKLEALQQHKLNVLQNA